MGSWAPITRSRSAATSRGGAATCRARSTRESDAEKLIAEGPRVVELSRTVESEAATGEFIGVMKATATGAGQLIEAFDRARAEHAGTVWREGRTFERAYLIDLLQHMLEAGTEMHRVDTRGGYMEIDTREDLGLAEQWWKTRDST